MWLQALNDQRVTIHNVKELHTIRKSNGEVIFTLLHVRATDPDGYALLPTVLLRGHFVSVMTILVDRETRDEWLLLVKQRRVGNGAFFYEHPAGMCDSEADPFEVAVKEVYEETGLLITRDQLQLLNQELLYSSPGLIDEAGYFFYCRIELDRVKIESYHDRLTGDAGEHERIRTYICSLPEAKSLMRNTNSLINWHLYYEFLRKSCDPH
jgi:8-oxo-dGTP pyrophosphatase MutT (NUDIX family)